MDKEIKKLEEQESFCSENTTERTPEEIKSLMNRLCRVEGQIRGIKKND